ncbi:MAG TPA: PilN domain-containing protein [Thermoanaerobaculia bacterium]|nr:PilN domain-containing protein [Thermoanaerobaculia bacterium]
MIKINLLSEGKRPTAVRRTRPASFLESENIALYALLAALLLVGLLPSAAWWWVKRAEVAANEEQIAAAQAEVDELAAIIREVEEFKAKQAELERKIGVIHELRRNQSGPVRVMDAVSRSLPELLWLDRMEMQGQQVTISGRAFNSNAVASFMDNLDSVESFQEPILRGMQERGDIYGFTLSFTFTNPPLPDEQGGAEGEPGAAEPAAAVGG